jgi:membrane protein implicated in regulation of membrane protease activity
MKAFLTSMEWWHWLVFAVALAAIETFLPGAVAIWFAASAALIGLLLIAIPIPWQLQFIGFAVMGVVAMLTYLNYRKKHPEKDEQPNLNQRGTQYIGSELVLIEPIEQGQGRARLGDGVWKVEGPELPAGARVRVTGVRGAVLTVVQS